MGDDYKGPKWQYAIAHITAYDIDELKETLNELGQDGWEAYTVYHRTIAEYTVYLKRRI